MKGGGGTFRAIDRAAAPLSTRAAASARRLFGHLFHHPTPKAAAIEVLALALLWSQPTLTALSPAFFIIWGLAYYAGWFAGRGAAAST